MQKKKLKLGAHGQSFRKGENNLQASGMSLEILVFNHAKNSAWIFSESFLSPFFFLVNELSVWVKSYQTEHRKRTIKPSFRVKQNTSRGTCLLCESVGIYWRHTYTFLLAFSQAHRFPQHGHTQPAETFYRIIPSPTYTLCCQACTIHILPLPISLPHKYSYKHAHWHTLLCRSQGPDHFSGGHIWWRETDQQLHAFNMPPGIISPHPVPLMGARATSRVVG